MKPWIVYTAIRISLFAVVLVVLLYVGVTSWLAAIIAAVVGLCVAYIFFRPQRDSLAQSVQVRRMPHGRSADEEAEDR